MASKALAKRTPRALTKRQEHAIAVLISKSMPSLMSVHSRGGWWPIIQESTTGAWQRNEPISVDTVATHDVVYTCVRLIASDVAKIKPGLIQRMGDGDDVWSETTNSAYSPVLRRPNNFENRIQFFASWMTSKLLWGNAYILKRRDERGVVDALYVLDPQRVRPLVSPDGSVFYECKTDHLATLPNAVVVPAREIIHDRMIPTLYHPLVGVSPIHACGRDAVEGLSIKTNSTSFFENSSMPGGVLTAPKSITETNAKAIKDAWDAGFSGDNFGKVAVLGDGMKFEKLAMTAEDAQLIDQLKLTNEAICRAFGVPAYMAGVGPTPGNSNVEALSQQYYSQCLQIHIESIELLLDEGLGLPTYLGIEFDLDQLIRMDTPTRVKAAADAVGSGVMSPDEARRKWFGLPNVPGGNTPYMQEQNWPLRQLNARPLPSDRPITEPAPLPDEDEGETVKALVAEYRKALRVVA